MLSIDRDYDDDACPVSDDVLAELHSANEGSLPGILEAIEPQIKPALAFFCYRRAHLQAVGLAIAASCEESELVFLGGRVGGALFARSRQELNFVQGFAQAVGGRTRSRPNVSYAAKNLPPIQK